MRVTLDRTSTALSDRAATDTSTPRIRKGVRAALKRSESVN
jgi:hypothetical protein